MTFYVEIIQQAGDCVVYSSTTAATALQAMVKKQSLYVLLQEL
jgi:hypothetical protein